MAGTNKISKEIAVFVVFLVLVALWGLFIKTPAGSNIPVNNELKVSNIHVQFENGTSEDEVEAILENCNMAVNYGIEYNDKNTADDYYLILDKDERDVRRELYEGMRKLRKRLDSAFSFTCYQERKLLRNYGI